MGVVYGSGRLSPLVTDGIAAATRALDCEVEVLGVPVDLEHRAVIIGLIEGGEGGEGSEDGAERLVLKTTRDNDEAERERAALAAIAALATHLPVPAVRFIDDTDGVSTTGLAYLDGDPIDHRQAPAEAWNAAAIALRTIHDLDPADLAPTPNHPDTVRAWAESLVADALALDLIDADVAERFRVTVEVRDRHPVQPAFVHGDASPQHFLQRRGRLTGIVDLDHSGVGDAAADLALLTLWEPGRIAAVVATYNNSTADSALELDHDTVDDLLGRINFHRPLWLLAGAVRSEQQGFSPAPFVVALYEELLKPAF